ncbi:MAG: type II toxin-antitoxin system VapC family toxin [Thermaerobacter sp.]|nr:type II toxin-antitoxin system VapC family toxin [Thermaerobacter sp.]
MIVYVDSSVLARAYLTDEQGHREVALLLDNSEIGLVTGTWTRIEVSGAIVRASATGRVDRAGLLELLDGDLGDEGRVAVVAADQVEIEARALTLVREHGLRAMDARHLAVAVLTLPDLAEPEEETGFATRDQKQGEVAQALGFVLV